MWLGLCDDQGFPLHPRTVSRTHESTVVWRIRSLSYNIIRFENSNAIEFHIFATCCPKSISFFLEEYSCELLIDPQGMNTTTPVMSAGDAMHLSPGAFYFRNEIVTGMYIQKDEQLQNSLRGIKFIPLKPEDRDDSKTE